MSISDELMARYYPLLLGKPLDPNAHPLEAKKHLALDDRRNVSLARSRPANPGRMERALQRKEIERRRSADILPGSDDIASIVVSAYANAFGLNKSRGDVRRLIEQGSVQLDGEKLRDPKAVLQLRSGQVLRLDKTHAVRIG